MWTRVHECISAWGVPGTVLSTLHISTHLILTQFDHVETITIIVIITILLIFQINKLRGRGV